MRKMQRQRWVRHSNSSGKSGARECAPLCWRSGGTRLPGEIKVTVTSTSTEVSAASRSTDDWVESAARRHRRRRNKLHGAHAQRQDERRRGRFSKGKRPAKMRSAAPLISHRATGRRSAGLSRRAEKGRRGSYQSRRPPPMQIESRITHRSLKTRPKRREIRTSSSLTRSM